MIIGINISLTTTYLYVPSPSIQLVLKNLKYYPFFVIRLHKKGSKKLVLLVPLQIGAKDLTVWKCRQQMHELKVQYIEFLGAGAPGSFGNSAKPLVE